MRASGALRKGGRRELVGEGVLGPCVAGEVASMLPALAVDTLPLLLEASRRGEVHRGLIRPDTGVPNSSPVIPDTREHNHIVTGYEFYAIQKFLT